MSTEQSRADFEVAFSKKCGVNVESIKEQRSSDGYWDEAHWRTKGISDAWYFWQKSRAALVVALPDRVMVEDEYDRGHNYGIEYCEEAIRAAGITVKEG